MIEIAISDLQGRYILGRIWNRTDTAWKLNPTKVTSSLERLKVTDSMREQSHSLLTFTQQVHNDSIRHVANLDLSTTPLKSGLKYPRS
jgi:hypothetical protein